MFSLITSRYKNWILPCLVFVIAPFAVLAESLSVPPDKTLNNGESMTVGNTDTALINLTGTFTNNGAFMTHVRLDNIGKFINGATGDAQLQNGLYIQAGALLNNSYIVELNGGTLDNYGSIVNNPGGMFFARETSNRGTVSNSGLFFSVKTPFDNYGTFTNEVGGTFNDYAIPSGITNKTGGTLNNNGAMNSSTLTNEAGATMNNNAGATLTTWGPHLNDGTLTNQGTVIIRPDTSFTQGAAGIYSGAGSFSLAGTLTNNQAVGTLSIATLGVASGKTGIVNGTGATAITTGNVSGTMNYTGSGGLSLAALNLSGGAFNNNGTGAVTVTTASVAGGQTGTIGGTGAIGLVTADVGGALTVSSTITGANHLTKNGAGTLTLSGANSYSGGTTVSAGTLQGTTTSIQGNVVNNGQVTFDQGADGTYAGNMSGTGSLAKNGAGTLTLSGANSFSGGTTVSAGTLQGTTASIQGNVVNNGQVTFDQGTDGTYAGNMSGTGSLAKNGAGTLTVTGANTYSGNTFINAGCLSLKGSLSSPVIIGPSGTLSGTGTINGNVINSGTLAKGNSIGTLTIAGNYTHNGGTYQVEVNTAGQSDRTVVAGTATLNGGTVTVLAAPGTYNYKTNYTILTAGSVVGTFAAVTSSLAFLTPSLSYDPTNVYLTLTRNSVSFADVASTYNQHAVASALDRISSGAAGDMADIINAVFLMSPENARSSYDQMGGGLHTAAAGAVLSSFNRYMNVLSERMKGFPSGGPRTGYAYQPAMLASLAGTGSDAGNTLAAALGNAARTQAPTWGLWATGYGAMGQRRGADISSRYDYDMAGFAAGFDRMITPSLLLGASLGYGYTKADMKDLSDKASVSQYEGSLYGTLAMNPFHVSGVVAYGYNRYSTKRDIAFAAVARRANADYAGQTFGGYLEGGYRIVTPSVDIIPIASLTGIYLMRNSFSEKDANALALDADSDTASSLVGSLGVRLTKDYRAASGTFTPELTLKWDHEFLNDDYVLNASFAGYPLSSFTARGDRPDSDSLGVALGLTWQTKENIHLNLTYNGNFSGDNTQHAGTLGIRYTW